MLLLAMMFNQRIDNFSTHQATPARHPNFSTCRHVYKVIHNHCALASCTLHLSHLLQHGVGVSIGGEGADLESHTWRTMRGFLKKHSRRLVSRKQCQKNSNCLPRILTATRQDCSDKWRSVLTHSVFFLTWAPIALSNGLVTGRNPG